MREHEDWLIEQESINAARDKIAHLQAELAALKPWAEVGKRAVHLYWWWHDDSEPYHCLMCMTAHDHAPDCSIPSLLAQLEVANAT